MAQKKTWIVKWMPHGDDIKDGCHYFRGDNNRAYESYEEAEERAMHVASESQRFVGVFELVEAVPIEVGGRAVTRTPKAATRRAPAKKKAAGRKR